MENKMEYSPLLEQKLHIELDESGEQISDILHSSLEVYETNEDKIRSIIEWLRYDIAGKMNHGKSNEFIMNYLLKVISLQTINPEKYYELQGQIEGIQADEFSISYTIEEN